MLVAISVALLLIGVATGALGQKSRMCFVGGFRDFILVRDTALLRGLMSFFATNWILVFVLSKTGVLVFHYPTLREALFSPYAIVSVAGGFVLGATATFTGGCPLRHHVLLGQGRLDSGVFFLGFYAGISLYYSFLAPLFKGIY